MKKDIETVYRELMSSDNGMVVLQELQDVFWINRTTLSSDPYETAFREGQRSVVLYIMTMAGLINREERSDHDGS